MKTGNVAISNIIQDFIDSNGLEHDEVNEGLLIKWGIDALEMMNLTEQLVNKIVLMRVEHSRAELPYDFKLLLNAAANVKDKHFVPTRREKLTQWIQGTHEKDCHLEINLICDKCHKPQDKCPCREEGSKIGFEVNVDKIWEAAHPEAFYSGYKRIGRFGYGPQGDDGKNRFELMRTAVQDFHKLNLIIGDCPNLNCIDCVRTFRVQPPYLEVDFDSGEVLMSYLGRVVDEKGDPMIPNHPDVLEAIGHHLDHKWYGRKWKKSNDTFAKTKSQEALQLREDCMGKAKSFLDTPEYTDFRAWFDTQYYKRLPDLNKSANINKHTRDKYDRLGDRLKY